MFSLSLGAAAGCLVVVCGLYMIPPLHHPHLSWWMFAPGVALAEVFVIHVRFNRHAHSISLSEIPLVMGLCYLTPTGLVLSQVLGLGLVLILHRRQRPIRIAFNVAQRAFTTVNAAIIFQAVLSLRPGSWPMLWLASLAATVSADLLAGFLIDMAISLSEGTRLSVANLVGQGTVITIASTALTLAMVMLFTIEPVAIMLMVLPAATTLIAGKAYADVQRNHESLIALHESTRLATGELDLNAMLPAVLRAAQDMFHAELGEVILVPASRAEPYLRIVVGTDEPATLEAVELDPLRGVWARIASEGSPILLARPIQNERLAQYFSGVGVRDLIAAPLVADDGVIGTVMMANRAGDFSTFDQADLKLLGTLGNHLGVAVRNARLVDQLRAALAHEAEMSKLKDDFVATVSHELRTPLTSVQGYLKTLLRPELDLAGPEKLEFLQRADRQAERLRRLIEDLLFASFMEASSRSLDLQEVSIPKTLQHLVEEFVPQEDRFRVSVSVEPPLDSVITSDEQVHRIVGNLVQNALKYAVPGSRILIIASAEDSGFAISVADDGPGIPPEEHERIFDRFYQVDHSSTRRAGGAGMGLYIARRGAEMLGGRLSLLRSDSSGSVFVLWLPGGPLGGTSSQPQLALTGSGGG
jgi:signal transduction histidine kinase